MPAIDRDRIGFAFDMHGCPNRCRHCYLGAGAKRQLTERDVRWAVGEIRVFLKSRPHIKTLTIASWFREPDFSDDYRRLYDLEAELSDGEPERHELLSIWRLARDEGYVRWAKSVGPDTCQISFFGMERTTDWFCRRRGAFKDAVSATNRLLDAGMKPRWQLFLTKRILPEIAQLLSLVDHLKLRERVRALGGQFQIFMHPPGPDHEGRKIEYLRPTMAEATDLPAEILASSRRYSGRETLWEPESELHSALLKDSAPPGAANVLPKVLWFFVRNDWDVYSNLGTLEEWWKLGNLRRDSVEAVIGRFERDQALGLQVRLRHAPARLAEEYGDPKGSKIYSDKGDLLSLYRSARCEELRRAT